MAALAFLLAVAVAALALLEFGRPSFVVVGAAAVVASAVPFVELSSFAVALQPFAEDSCFSAAVAFVFDDHVAASVKRRAFAEEAFD